MRAWELHHQGWKQGKIAEALGVLQGGVSHWLKRARDVGMEALRYELPVAIPQFRHKRNGIRACIKPARLTL